MFVSRRGQLPGAIKGPISDGVMEGEGDRYREGERVTPELDSNLLKLASVWTGAAVYVVGRMGGERERLGILSSRRDGRGFPV